MSLSVIISYCGVVLEGRLELMIRPVRGRRGRGVKERWRWLSKLVVSVLDFDVVQSTRDLPMDESSVSLKTSDI